MIIGCAHDVSQMCANQIYEKVGSIRGILSRMSGVSSLGWSFLILLYGHWKSCSFSVREVSWQWEWLHFWKVLMGFVPIIGAERLSVTRAMLGLRSQVEEVPQRGFSRVGELHLGVYLFRDCKC